MADRFHQLILFGDAHFDGGHKHVFRSIPYLDDFNDVVSSFAVLAGTWQLYSDSEFRTAYGSVFAPRVGGYGWVEDYDVVNDTASCVRLTAEETRQVPHLILFTNDDFGGDHKHVFGALDTSHSWGGTKSLVIFAGSWNFQLADGSTTTLGPGTFPLTSTALGASIKSIAIADSSVTGPALPHLILFDDAGFKGSHKHVFHDMRTLGSWKGRVSAIAVENGSWRVFVQDDFASPEGQRLTRGIYPYVEDYDIENDKASSVKQDPQGSPAALVTAANMNDGQSMLMAHGDKYRLGWNQHETSLTPRNVRVPDFGLLWRRSDILGQDGKPAKVYGQPLYATIATPGAPAQDVVVVATASNDVLALDANTGATVWQQHLGASNNALDDDDFNAGLQDSCKNTSPLHGVNGTPIIVPVGGQLFLYVCFLAKIDPNGGQGNETNDWNQGYFIQALDVATGAAPPFFPEPIPLVGNFTHTDGKVIRFRPYMHTQRGALTFFPGALGDARGWVLSTFSSRCDIFGKAENEDWQGWIIGVPAGGRPRTPVLFSTSTNQKGKDGCGGIWGTAGISVDDTDAMYTVSGNGKFDGVENWGDTVIKLRSLRDVADSYTARDWQAKFDNDQDLGSCSAVLLPPLPTTPAGPIGRIRPTLNVVASGGKDGRVYLMNADEMGGLGGALWKQQVFSGGAQLYTDGLGVTPAFFDGGPAGKFLYYCSASDSPNRGMVAIHFDDIEGEGQFGVRVVQFEGKRFTGAPGSPFVSSNGAVDAVVWAVDSFRGGDDDGGQDSILRAWDAVSGELLYGSPETVAQSLGNGRKFASIAVIKGKVIVGARSVACYGLKREDL